MRLPFLKRTKKAPKHEYVLEVVRPCVCGSFDFRQSTMLGLINCGVCGAVYAYGSLVTATEPRVRLAKKEIQK